MVLKEQRVNHGDRVAISRNTGKEITSQCFAIQPDFLQL